MNILRINTRSKSYISEVVPPAWEHLGGRGLIARILVDEVPAECAPLGPENKLIFAPGLLVGHRLSSCDRLSVGGKSPLTGGVKEANAGGTTGYQITFLGFKALILEDKPTDDQWTVIFVDDKSVRFDDANDLIGLGVYESAKRLVSRYGDHAAISLIGPGGEMQLAAAGIQNLDKDHVPSRINARGGLGAVMGSKHIKAIVFDSRKGSVPVIADEAGFKAARKIFSKAVLDHPQTKTYAEYGTAAMAKMCNGFGALPTRNFSSGEFDSVEKISGEYLRELLLKRGGESNTTHACMAGCTIRCSNVFGNVDGKEVVSPIEYETIGLMGSNLGISSLDTIAHMNWKVNDLGLDTIDIGAALGVAAEAGLMEFGDGDAALRLIDEIYQGTELGQTLGNGAAATGKEYGIERVPVVKGQALSAYDPRAIKGTGVTYATSPQGGDHTAGLTIRAKVDHLDPEGQAELSRIAQVKMAGYDTLGACIFAGFGFAAAPETIRDLLNARYGWQVDENILLTLGEETLALEVQFNRMAGFTNKDDRIPEWMMREPLQPTNAVFDVPDSDLDSVFG